MKKPDDGKPNRKSARLGCGCLMSPFLLLVVLGFGTPFYNNSRMSRLERNFAGLSHPASSQFLRREKFIGLIGNGNHCDFVVAELRSYSKTGQIRSAYAASRLAVPNDADDDSQGTKGGTQPVELEFLPSPLPKGYRWKYHGVFDWNLSALAGQHLYVVIMHNSGENDSWDSLCDWRCL
jgi:hypothetical protein